MGQIVKQPSDLRRIAGEIRDRCPGAAGELASFADFLEDLDAAKKRKLEMIANMPPSRAATMQKTIDFHQAAAVAAEARVEKLENALTEALLALGQAVDVITLAVKPGGVIPLVKVGALEKARTLEA